LRFNGCPIPKGLYHPAQPWTTQSAYAGSRPENPSERVGSIPHIPFVKRNFIAPQ
jgi:hypothetical protein